MKLNETKSGDTVLVANLNGISRERRNSLRDMGLYEHGLAYIDAVENGAVRFHKDSISITVSAEEAAGVEVVYAHPVDGMRD